jgi:2-C-methyl-D-erythritol 4-phosphate cytidylyltransferase
LQGDDKVDLIILSAGTGKRTKLNYPKQLMRLGGKPILIHIVEKFLQFNIIENIIITIPPDTEELFDLFYKYNINTSKIKCVTGGETRQKSVYNALEYCDSNKIMIHESARPFIDNNFINSIINTNELVVVPYIKFNPTMYYTDGLYLDREKVYNIQLPQLYDSVTLKLAHEFGKYKNYTDDSSLVLKELGISPTFIEGYEENIKITTPLDIKLAEVIYEEFSNSNRW